MLENLKLLRQEHGISQQRLADAIGVSQPSINKYENHSIEPEIEILKRMAEFFNTSIDYIVGNTDIREKIERKDFYELNSNELKMLSSYRALTKRQQECINCTIDTFLSTK